MKSVGILKMISFGILAVLHLVFCKMTCICFTLTEKQIIATFAHLFQFWFKETIPVFVPNVWANEHSRNRNSSFNAQVKLQTRLVITEVSWRISKKDARRKNFRLVQTETN